MTADELNERTENESEPRIRPHYSIKWTRIPTVFGHSLLVATLAYPLNDANELTRHPARVLSKVYAECVEDTLSRFVFWLTADLNIERSDFDKETRDAIRTELSKTVKPLTARQIVQMNAHVNSLPDYLRAFYLEDYFDSLAKRRAGSRSLVKGHRTR
ncbi:MAG: hypothetical protein ACXVIP_04975 [Halobacteriota archaeon]